MKDLVEAGLVSTNGSYKDIDYISLKDTIENQKSAGLTCKENKGKCLYFQEINSYLDNLYLFREENRGNI